MADNGLDGIGRFLRERSADLQRIVRHARGDVELGDVQNEAWLVATDLQRRRGYPIDFSDSTDQESVLGRLYNRFVKYAEKHFRYAVKLDVDWDKEESTALGAVLARILTAPASASPDDRIQKQQEGKDVLAAVQRSYSEAAAYVLLLMRFDWDASELAGHLRIAIATLRMKLKLAGIKVKVQPSLFDGWDRISPDFTPTSGRPALPSCVHLSGTQWSWEF